MNKIGKEINKKKTLIVSLLLVLAITGTALTVAFSVAQTEPVVNTFSPADLDTEIEEKVDPSAWKKEVTVKNNSQDSAAFIRARITTSPEELLGTVIGIEGMDPAWKDGEDGFYYYTVAVAPGHSTSFIMKSIKLMEGNDNFTGDFDVMVYQESVVATLPDGTTNVDIDEMKAAFAAAEASK